MSFNSPIYLLVLIASILAVRLPPRVSAWLLLAICAIFYFYAGAFDFFLFVAIIIANWLAVRNVKESRLVFWLAIAGNLAVLAFFKYREMLLPDSVSSDFGRIAIPLGISFYLFHIFAYLTDVRMGRTRLVGLHKFALFVGFFPHLIAGPIVRANQLMPQLERFWKGPRVRRQLVFFGIALCLLGLVKKVVFADSLAPVVNDLFHTVPTNALTAWAGAWLFGFQIYFDFSGYTDIALGSAMLLGIRLPINFRTPYLATNPREFWHRWHITLSMWIRDYLYLPLGGSREGGPVWQASVLVGVLALAGLWHGANWTFVVWGTLWGFYILIWRLIGPLAAKIPLALKWSVHILIVMVLWVFFRAPDIGFALRYIGSMFSFDLAAQPTRVIFFGVFGCAGLMVLHWLESLTQQASALLVLRRMYHPIVVGIMVGFCALLLLFPKYEINPFIYFRF
jgi:alginate O-acetyltransferase complex protein AlgI